MKKNLFLSFITLVLFSIILIGCSKEKAYRSIKIFSYKGTCNIIRGKKELDLAKEMKIKNNDELQVKEDSQAVLKLDNDKFVCVKENTDVKFVATGKENNTKTRLHVNNGGVIVEVKEKLQDKESFEIASSNSVMAIRGTQISFDVSKTTDSITTTFSILTGKTETFLYKDETMNSTTLIQDKMMSYTTSLNKTTDEIYKLYDKFKPVEINDTDLKNNYNTEKLDLTDEKANEIINVINNFEREEKIDERVTKEKIDFTMDSELVYGTSLFDHITNEHNLGVYYSNSVDGTYSLLKENETLDAGSYYIKLDGEKYETDPKLLTITKKEMTFSIDRQLSYGTNLLNEIKEADYPYSPYISNSIDGRYTLYNKNNFLSVGTYYIKLEGKNYITDALELEITKAAINLPINYEQKMDLTAGLGLKISLDDNIFLKSPFAQEMDGNNYKYNISGTIIDDEGNQVATFTLDYGNKTYLFIFEGMDPKDLTIDYTYNIPTDTFNVENDSEVGRSFESWFYITKESVSYNSENSANFSAYMRYFTSERTGNLSYYANYKYDDAEQYTEESLDDDNGAYSLFLQNLDGHDTVTVYFTVKNNTGTILDRSEEYVIDLDILFNTDFEFIPDTNFNNSFATYTDDGKVNAYYDTGFVNKSDLELSYYGAYGSYEYGEMSTEFGELIEISGNTRYLEIKNLDGKNNDYAFYNLRVRYIDENGLIYFLTLDEFDPSGELADRIIYNKQVYLSGTYDYEESMFDVGVYARTNYSASGLSVVVLNEYDGEEYVYDNFTGNSQSQFLPTDDEYELSVEYSYTEYVCFSGEFLNDLFDVETYSENILIKSEEMLNSIKEAFANKYDIEIDGTYSITYNGIPTTLEQV